jgi:hypothetical protein
MAMSSASVPELTATHCAAPARRASSVSSSATSGEDSVDAAPHLGTDTGLLGAEVEEGHRRADGRRWVGALLLSQAHRSLVWFCGGFRKFGARDAEPGALGSHIEGNERFCFFLQKEALSFL